MIGASFYKDEPLALGVEGSRWRLKCNCEKRELTEAEMEWQCFMRENLGYT